MSRSSRKCSWIIQNLAKPPLMRICRGFENWCDLRALSGKFLRQKSCYPESFRFLWLCRHDIQIPDFNKSHLPSTLKDIFNCIQLLYSDILKINPWFSINMGISEDHHMSCYRRPSNLRHLIEKICYMNIKEMFTSHPCAYL